MSKGIIGRKLGMTQVYDENGRAVPVTVVEAGPCPVVAIRTPEKNGYVAIQLGFGAIKKGRVSKPLQGHYDKVGVEPRRWLREFRLRDPKAYELGQYVTVEIFTPGEKVNATGRSKGKGFAGVMKRHNYGGGAKSHGASVIHRRPGSIGCHTYPGRVFKGKTMAGHMGDERVTVKNLTVFAVDAENHLLLIKGSIPGARNGLVMVHKHEA
ncbi:MAG TPA: 50S ribosomal protein L3 [Synergistaceae bacterium]|nr:50S ribosomal protein L3 [Synergistaceae bacterium]HQF90952.1 50S ribosomal protein L3 [Synergistaceae bacterium]HQH78587.1 50S ribosomal protein L3 [Synergistaceae bacterium]HQK24252.1 50S ribosomal protein L3 [Synergistaceae bacterium]